MPNISRLMFISGTIMEELAECERWLDDQQIIVKPQKKRLAKIRELVDELYKEAQLEYDAEQ